MIPFSDVAGRGFIDVPEQTGAGCAKEGVIAEVTSTVMVVAVAHCPALGVKV